MLLVLATAIILGTPVPAKAPKAPKPPAVPYPVQIERAPEPHETVEFDTVFSVRPGARFQLVNFSGDIDVRAWAKSAVRVAASHSARARVWVGTSDSLIRVKARAVRMAPRVDYEINVPAWMPLALTGMHSDIEIHGMKSAISAETVQGGVRLTGGEGEITLCAVQGGVEVEGARGKLSLSSVNDDVQVVDSYGELIAETLNGSIMFERVDSKLVEATTMNGGITYDGGFARDGSYRFATHNGSIDLGVPRGSDADFSVYTVSGEFESAFPVPLTEIRGGRRFRFVVGSGGAQVSLSSFSGSIQLRSTGKNPKE
jgi:hypothetical protein